MMERHRLLHHLQPLVKRSQPTEGPGTKGSSNTVISNVLPTLHHRLTGNIMKVPSGHSDSTSISDANSRGFKIILRTNDTTWIAQPTPGCSSFVMKLSPKTARSCSDWS